MSAEEIDVISSIRASGTGCSVRGRSAVQKSAQHGRMAAFANTATVSQTGCPPRNAMVVFPQSTFRSAAAIASVSPAKAASFTQRHAVGDIVGK
jgi:hypothetical protein